MYKKKKHQQISWTERTSSALDRYFKWESKPHIQERIYKEHIEVILRNIILTMIIKEQSKGNWEKLFEYSFKDYNIKDDDGIKLNPIIEERKNLVDECISIFFTTLCPYIKNGTIKNYGAYIYKGLKHYLTQKNIENSRKVNYSDPLPTMDSENEKFFRNNSEFLKITDSNITDSETEFVNLMMNYWEQNIDFIWNRKNHVLHRQVAYNVLELFRRSHTIKYFRITSMRRYLRRMMEWKKDTKYNNSKRNVFNDVILTMRDITRHQRTHYRKKGMINFHLNY